jgi:thymidylate kinase
MCQDLKKVVQYDWEERHAQILDAFLQELNQNEVEYFVLRNFEGLPENNNSKDVDLIIKPGQYKKSAELLMCVFKSFEIPNYYTVKYERVHCWFGIDFINDFSIHIDLIEGYLNKGFEIFSFDELYKSTVDYRGYKVLNTPYDLAMLLFYKVIGCKELKEKYVSKIRSGYLENKVEIDNILQIILGNKMANKVINALDFNDYKWIVANASQLSKSSKIIAFRGKPFYTLNNIFNFLNDKFYRIIIAPKKHRKLIAVEAPDGTGKTTFIYEMSILLARIFVTELKNIHVYHFRPSLLPNLGALGEKTGMIKQDTNFTNPHRNVTANSFSSLVRMLYYWFDYVFGGMLCIRQDVQFDRFSVFDRYVYDFIVDPIRSRINLPRWIRVMFSKLVPQPEIVFILKADADVIYKRKQELTLDEIARQLVEFDRLKEFGHRFVELDANQKTDIIAKQAVEVIIDKYTSRTGR